MSGEKVENKGGGEGLNWREWRKWGEKEIGHPLLLLYNERTV